MEILANHKAGRGREKQDIPVAGIFLEIHHPLGELKEGEETVGPLVSLSSFEAEEVDSL